MPIQLEYYRKNIKKKDNTKVKLTIEGVLNSSWVNLKACFMSKKVSANLFR